MTTGPQTYQAEGAEIRKESQKWDALVPQFDALVDQARTMTFLDPYDPGEFQPMVAAHTRVHDKLMAFCDQASEVMFKIGNTLVKIASTYEHLDEDQTAALGAVSKKVLTIMAPEPVPVPRPRRVK
jgi:hypothetical protein